jgi:hypothetical protein
MTKTWLGSESREETQEVNLEKKLSRLGCRKMSASSVRMYLPPMLPMRTPWAASPPCQIASFCPRNLKLRTSEPLLALCSPCIDLQPLH